MRIGVIVIGHVASSRLEEKMLLPMNGQPFLGQVLDFAKASWAAGPLIFATTTDTPDDQLAELAEKKGITTIRGHATDILQRYLKAATTYQLDGIITWDGDDAFVDGRCLNRVQELLEQGADYVRPKDLPYGTFCYGISTRALQQVMALKNKENTHVWGRYFTEIPGLKVVDYEFSQYAPLSKLRLTLDYPEDYELIKRVCAFIENEGRGLEKLDAIAAFSDRYPEDCLLNQNRIEEYQRRWQQQYENISLKKP